MKTNWATTFGGENQGATRTKKLHLVLAFAGLLLATPTLLLASPALNLPAHHIQQVEMKEARSPDYTQWQNFLTFSNTTTRVPLARSAVRRIAGLEDFHTGFDPASLKLCWLKEGELLWICWTTHSLGSGHYMYDGHVVLQLRGDSIRELFRDHFSSAARGGWAAEHCASLEIGYDDKAMRFTFTRRTLEVNGDTKPPKVSLPFLTVIQGDNGTMYLSKVNTIDTWHYKLAGDRLKFLGGTTALDLGEDQQPFEEIVKSFHVSRAALEKLNPALRSQSQASGVVLLDTKLKAYQTSSHDGLPLEK